MKCKFRRLTFRMPRSTVGIRFVFNGAQAAVSSFTAPRMWLCGRVPYVRRTSNSLRVSQTPADPCRALEKTREIGSPQALFALKMRKCIFTRYIRAFTAACGCFFPLSLAGSLVGIPTHDRLVPRPKALSTVQSIYPWGAAGQVLRLRNK